MPPHNGPWEHGTVSMYQRKCRCDDCRAAQADSIRSLRGQIPPNHGRSGYENYGCRCEECCAAMRDHRRSMLPRKRVWAAVERAVKRGSLVRPTCCEGCGQGGELQAHHEDYSKPLDVTWLCTACHGARHAWRYAGVASLPPDVVSYEHVPGRLFTVAA